MEDVITEKLVNCLQNVKLVEHSHQKKHFEDRRGSKKNDPRFPKTGTKSPIHHKAIMIQINGSKL